MRCRLMDKLNDNRAKSNLWENVNWWTSVFYWILESIIIVQLILNFAIVEVFGEEKRFS